ncbi:hypothetical protein ABEF95_009494 [Exophiala dermatitidis]
MAHIEPAVYVGLLESGKYSDLIIDCREFAFNVHRTVVCSQSPMLDAACSGQFEEASSGRIKFPELHPAIIARAILFMYTGDYDEVSLPKFYMKMSGSEDYDCYKDFIFDSIKKIDDLGLRHPLKINALLYACADMLGIPGLKTVASARFMRDAKIAFGHDWFEVPLRLLYENTPLADRGLRFQATCLCVENYDCLDHQTKTLQVLQEHEPNVWSVAVEVLKQWKSSDQSHSRTKQRQGNEGTPKKQGMGKGADQTRITGST